MEHLILPATIALILYAVLGAIDSIYLHIWRHRLHARPESRREHLWHTLRALLYPAGIGLLFVAPTGGALLWAGLFVVAIDLGVMLADVLEEHASRERLGGLPRGEYALHIALTALHIASLALILSARPLAAWSLGAPAVLSATYPAYAEFIAVNLIPGGVLVALAHILLIWRPDLLPATADRPIPTAQPQAH